MCIAIVGVNYFSHCYTWSEALCSFIYMECKFMLIATPGVKHNARSGALCSLLYMECSFMLIAIYEVKLYAHCYRWS